MSCWGEAVIVAYIAVIVPPPGWGERPHGTDCAINEHQDGEDDTDSGVTATALMSYRRSRAAPPRGPLGAHGFLERDGAPGGMTWAAPGGRGETDNPGKPWNDDVGDGDVEPMHRGGAMRNPATAIGLCGGWADSQQDGRDNGTAAQVAPPAVTHFTSFCEQLV